MDASDWSSPSVPQVVLAGLVVAIAGLVVFSAGTSGATFSTFNTEWDGASSLRSVADDAGLDVTVTGDTAAYSSATPPGTVAFVLSPDSAYRSGEAGRVAEFVRTGGTLVVAGDFGPHADDLLGSVGASARLDTGRLRDGYSNYRSPVMPVATGVANHSLVAGVESVTLNHATAVTPNGATTLVNTSDYAYLDTNGNATLDRSESVRSYPVATVESVGAGRVVVVSDPSVFINAMLDRPGNRQFARSLLADHRTLLLDYSHVESALPPAVLGVLLVRQSAVLQLGLGALVVGALAVWSRRPAVGAESVLAITSGRPVARVGRRIRQTLPERWRSAFARSDDEDRPRASPAELVAHLERRYPDWDRERVERVVSALERRDE
ncbi:DUF4350 domain-containing protein [Halorussus lipolyticus]|uniref:DUF4350 domain-containing protein n=1 Tax=Halorussus lipolyticus TaxID=3034024 RepID=UPI0023E8D028|nr:DUF4350 domain-containing protein [Halorussus sp. DT80]